MGDDHPALADQLTAIHEGQRELAGVLEAFATALQAMSDQLDALTDAMLGQDDGGAVTSLDGELEGLERDQLGEL